MSDDNLLNELIMKEKTELQKLFESQFPPLEHIASEDYLQAYCDWLEFQINSKLYAFVRIKDSMPIAWESGNWDGRRSDLIIIMLGHSKYKLGYRYNGFMDGHEFNTWCDEDGCEIEEPVIAWAKLP